MRSFFLSPVLVFSYILVLSCNSNKSRPKNETQDSDSLVKKFYLSPEVFYENADSQNLYYETKVLGLDDIERGYDSFQLRIVIAYTEKRKVDDSLKILTLKKKGVSSTVEIISVKNEYSGDSLFQSVYLRRNNKFPQEEWVNFSKKFNSIKLFNSPFIVIDEEKSIVHDPTSITIKVSNNKGEYRKYRYLLPGVYKGAYWQIDDLRSFLKLISEEFDFSP
ncbi:MAG: hypothetical protein JNJ86_08750 [Chitinophagaceae bacterium]|nr:hypothetical protein [Chitinophagaceae bacterium]